MHAILTTRLFAGIFQINDHDWCGDGKLCGHPCEDYLDSDISDDWQCAQLGFNRNGFGAWDAYYLNSCDRKLEKYTSVCFEGLDESGRPLETGHTKA